MRAESGAAACERVRVGRRSVWSGLTLTLTLTLTLATAPWRSAPSSSASTSPSPSRPGGSARHDGFRRRRRRCDMELPARLGVLSLSLCIPPCLHMSCLVHTIQVTDTYDPLTHLNHFTGTTVEPCHHRVCFVATAPLVCDLQYVSTSSTVHMLSVLSPWRRG